MNIKRNTKANVEIIWPVQYSLKIIFHQRNNNKVSQTIDFKTQSIFFVNFWPTLFITLQANNRVKIKLRIFQFVHILISYAYLVKPTLFVKLGGYYQFVLSYAKGWNQQLKSVFIIQLWKPVIWTLMSTYKSQDNVGN